MDRSGEREEGVDPQRGDVAGVQALADPENDPSDVTQAVGGQYVPHLLPRGVHVALLVLPHHLGAEPRRGPVTGVDVELAQPARLGRGDGVAAYRPASVDGRRHRLGLGRRTLGEVGVRRVEQAHQRVDEGRLGLHLGAFIRLRRMQRSSSSRIPPASGASAGSAGSAAPTNIGRRPTVSATGRGTSLRASDSKSPAGPVLNDQW